MRYVVFILLFLSLGLGAQNIDQLRPDTAAGSIPMTIAPYFRQAYARPQAVADTLLKYMELDTFYQVGTDSVCLRVFPNDPISCWPIGGTGGGGSDTCRHELAQVNDSTIALLDCLGDTLQTVILPKCIQSMYALPDSSNRLILTWCDGSPKDTVDFFGGAMANSADTASVWKDDTVTVYQFNMDHEIIDSFPIVIPRDSIDSYTSRGTFADDTLTVYRERAGVEFDSFKVEIIIDSDTDIDSMKLIGNVLHIYEDDVELTTDFSQFLDNTDDQQISLITDGQQDTITLEDGGSVVLNDSVGVDYDFVLLDGDTSLTLVDTLIPRDSSDLHKLIYRPGKMRLGDTLPDKSVYDTLAFRVGYDSSATIQLANQLVGIDIYHQDSVYPMLARTDRTDWYTRIRNEGAFDSLPSFFEFGASSWHDSTGTDYDRDTSSRKILSISSQANQGALSIIRGGMQSDDYTSAREVDTSNVYAISAVDSGGYFILLHLDSLGDINIINPPDSDWLVPVTNLIPGISDDRYTLGRVRIGQDSIETTSAKVIIQGGTVPLLTYGSASVNLFRQGTRSDNQRWDYLVQGGALSIYHGDDDAMTQGRYLFLEGGYDGGSFDIMTLRNDGDVSFGLYPNSRDDGEISDSITKIYYPDVNGNLLMASIDSLAAAIDATGLITGADSLGRNGTAGQIVVETNTKAPNSSPNLFWDGDELGIGTNAPMQALHVISQFLGDGLRISASGTNGPGLRLYNDVSGAQAQNLLAMATNQGIIGSVANDYVIRTAGGNMLFATTATLGGVSSEAMRIDTSKRIGIGTTTPSYKLDFSGSITDAQIGINSTHSSSGEAGIDFRNSGDNADTWRLARFASGNFALAYSSAYVYSNTSFPFVVEAGASSNQLRLDASGVGINGVTAPTADLHVDGTIRLQDFGTGTDSGTPTYFWGPTNSNGDMGVFPITDIVSAAEKSKWTDGGTTTYLTSTTDNVHIGSTANANEKLEVTASTSGIYVTSTNASGDASVYLANSGDNNNTFKFFRGGAGNFGIATSATFPFGAFTTPFVIEAGTGNDAFRIDNSGIGIGTNSPSQALHVVGTGLFSSLAGTGTRMVTASSTGVLSTATIPSGADGNGIYGGSNNVPAGTTATLLGNFLISSESISKLAIGSSVTTALRSTNGASVYVGETGDEWGLYHDSGSAQTRLRNVARGTSTYFFIGDSGAGAGLQSTGSTSFVGSSTSMSATGTTLGFSANTSISMSSGTFMSISAGSTMDFDATQFGFNDNSQSLYIFEATGNMNIGNANATGGSAEYITITSTGIGINTGGTTAISATTNNVELHGGVTGTYGLEVSGSQASSSATTFTVVSDRRQKENIVPIADAYDKIMKLNPVTFNYNEAYRTQYNQQKTLKKGFIAQDYQNVFPEDVIENEGTLSMNVDAVTPYSVAAIQQLIRDNEQQAAQIGVLTDQINKLYDLINRK